MIKVLRHNRGPSDDKIMSGALSEEPGEGSHSKSYTVGEDFSTHVSDSDIPTIHKKTTSQLGKDTHPTFKNGERCEQALHKRGNPNVQELMRRCLPLSGITKLKMKSTVRNRYRWFKLTTSSVGKDMEQVALP